MGGPYRPKEALVGGVPTVKVDIPICAVFLALFVGGAVSHMGLFRHNMMRKHKFIPSAVTFGFCMSRISANSVRIAWACHPENLQLGIAAQIFVAAGVVLLFILNLLYSQRMLRAAHPHVGWTRPVSLAFKLLYLLIILTIAMAIVVTVQSSYSLNNNTHRIDRDVLLYVSTFFAVVTFLPLLIVPTVLICPRRNERVEKFGKGSWRAKAAIICLVAVLLCLGASFRAATVWEPPRPAGDPAWYHSKAAFYVFNFTLEIIVVYIYLFVRMDLRFHVPNGSSKVRHYRGNFQDLATEQPESSPTDEKQEDRKEGENVEQEVEVNRDLESSGVSLSEVPITSQKEQPGKTVDSLPSSQEPEHSAEQITEIRE
ncbi:hypothetical protein ASPWEDRAFT_39446 [Aspergillus wentii DTO 134E9]|uniref:Uncharacterized protein n=1 Tax=Aspergillus wentii DTO 134E9 TaxID=1073089 RepID=A0A1L9RS24_ASPWE|nr:uncharacterized protein ASPWEDRAFT_39446 [Aspergillus wentii DTO 134E9]KAI9930547.1 hypothetical protein MW887_011301 [Aspergillus wentii]OJJ37709.1 hypothetical protein ASPWEDRAFT_39446 [Aspergillus wentii DTO 134E9]